MSTTTFTNAGKKTYVALVLDESGSMETMREAAVRLFNEQADTIRKRGKDGGDTFVSLFKFGSSLAPHTDEVFHARPAAQCPSLKPENYVPQNGTPMRDGIGRAITRLEAEDDKGPDTAFLVIVITDGQENQSRDWSVQRLRDKVNALQATGRWTFAVYGANISLADLHETTGFGHNTVPASNFASYVGTAQGIGIASAGLQANTSSYFGKRSVGQTQTMDFTDVTGPATPPVPTTTFDEP